MAQANKAPRKTRKAKQPSGYIIYRGPSMLDGKPIVVVAIVGESKNAKTGDMVQTYILVDNGMLPVDSARLLEDVSVCGDCKHRRGLDGSCYVNLGQGPRSVMDGVMRGIYPLSDGYNVGNAVFGRKVRLGTYGDPMAVPVHVWETLLENAADHTGYTHQWNNPKFVGKHVRADDPLYAVQYQGIRELCMASVDTEDERALAGFENWRTFRVKPEGDDWVNSDEFTCPASAEAGKKKQCNECMACDGVGVNEARIKRPDVVINVHGSLKSRFVQSVAVHA